MFLLTRISATAFTSAICFFRRHLCLMGLGSVRFRPLTHLAPTSFDDNMDLSPDQAPPVGVTMLMTDIAIFS